MYNYNFPGSYSKWTTGFQLHCSAVRYGKLEQVKVSLAEGKCFFPFMQLLNAELDQAKEELILQNYSVPATVPRIIFKWYLWWRCGRKDGISSKDTASSPGNVQSKTCRLLACFTLVGLGGWKCFASETPIMMAHHVASVTLRKLSKYCVVCEQTCDWLLTILTFHTKDTVIFLITLSSRGIFVTSSSLLWLTFLAVNIYLINMTI